MNRINGQFNPVLRGHSVLNLVTNGNFANGTTGWSASGATNAVANNTFTNTASGVAVSGFLYGTAFAPAIGDKLYLRSKQKVTNANSILMRLCVYDGTAAIVAQDQVNPTINTQYLMSGVITTTRLSNHYIYMIHQYVNAATANGKVMEVQEVMLINLTTLFGAGNEPSAAWCDANFPTWFDGTKETVYYISTFPDLAAGEAFIILIHDNTSGFGGVKEIMEVGAINKGTGILSAVTRAREGTVAQTHAIGARVECVWTAGTHGELADNADLEAHLLDYVPHIPYGVATGSANTYAVTLAPVPSSYIEGMGVAVKINVDNTGASTINVNSLGAKTIKKPNGTDVSAGNLKAGSIYSVRYNGTNFILQGSDSAGDATTGDVLSGKTFSSDSDVGITGTMPNRGAVNITPGTAAQTIQEGYHNGSGSVAGDADLVASNIKNGVNIFGEVGNYTGGGIKAVVTGTATLTVTAGTVVTQDITITAVSDYEKCVPIVEVITRGSDADADNMNMIAFLTSNTNLRIIRYAAGTNSGHTIRYQVLEFENIKSLQKGATASGTSFPRNVTLTTSVNLAKSMVFGSFRFDDSNTNTRLIDMSFSCYLSATNQVRFEIMGDGGGTYNVVGYYHVVEFN